MGVQRRLRDQEKLEVDTLVPYPDKCTNPQWFFCGIPHSTRRNATGPINTADAAKLYL